MTSPYHSQPNKKVESAVKIVKSIFKKSQRNKRDLWLFILGWRNTPTEFINTSPVQRLFSRRTKTVSPTTSDLLTSKVEKGENVTKLLNDKRKIFKRGGHTNTTKVEKFILVVEKRSSICSVPDFMIFVPNKKCFLKKGCRDLCMPNAWLQLARLMLLICRSCSASHNIYRLKFCATSFLCPTVGGLDI